MTTMQDNRSAEYIVRWPHAIARATGISVEHVAEALRRVTGVQVKQSVFYHSEQANTPVTEIGCLSPEQAKAVVAAMQQIKQEITAAQKTHCWSCGLKLRDGKCPGC